MELCNTKKNHFVPQFYLKSFLNKEGILYVGDMEKKNIFSVKESGLVGIGMKNNLYAITNKIGIPEIEFLRMFSKREEFCEVENTFLEALVSFLNDEMGKMFSIEIKKEGMEDIEKEFNDMLKGKMNNETVSRNQELLFSLYESGFIPLYNDILSSEKISCIKGDIVNYENYETEVALGFYLYEKVTSFIYGQMARKMTMAFDVNGPSGFPGFMGKVEYFDFLHYIIIQYFRTDKHINIEFDEAAQKRLENNGIFMENIFFLINHFQAIDMASILHLDGYKFVLIRNESKVDFITSDSPCINTYYYVPEELYRDLEKDEFELYFPLSPKLSILYTKQEYRGNGDVISDKSDDSISMYNEAISKCAKRFIYSKSKDSLLKYCSRD